MLGLDPSIWRHERLPWFRLRIPRREITGSSPVMTIRWFDDDTVVAIGHIA
jgi:hypothetical protein